MLFIDMVCHRKSVYAQRDEIRYNAEYAMLYNDEGVQSEYTLRMLTNAKGLAATTLLRCLLSVSVQNAEYDATY